MSLKLTFVVTGLLTFVLAIVRIGWSAEPTNGVGDLSAVDSYLTTAMQRHNIPGLALTVTKDQQVIYAKGYGAAGDGRTVSPDMPFTIGSQSKSFTALAVMQLVEQGKIDLDAPVQKYLTWFRVADEQASRQITIRNLLQHTSGLSEFGYVENFAPDATLEMIVRDLARARLTAPVGSKFQYFNPGYSTLGLLIETVSGQSYGNYIHEHIFVPLKMAHSFSDPGEAKAAGLVQGYSQIFGFAVPLDQPFYRYDLPAGFLMSSANDMARYLMALGNGGELEGVRVLKPENVQMLFTPNVRLDNPYGFGWYIAKYYGETQITHGGDSERFHTSVLILPEHKMSLVLLFNENHLLKDYNEYDTIFWSVVGMLTDHPLPAERLSSTFYGWGLLALWFTILGLTGFNIARLPQWRVKMMTWVPYRRWLDVFRHVLWAAVAVLAMTVIGPAFLNRGFNWIWFTGFLPDVALVVMTLIIGDVLQAGIKVWIICFKVRPALKGTNSQLA